MEGKKMKQKQQKSGNTVLTIRMMLFSVIGLLVSNVLPAVEFCVNKDPKPTFTEKNFVLLEKINQIEDSDDQENILAYPKAMTADSKGNLYVFDTAQTKVFKINKDLKIVKSYGQSGEGPGDFINAFRYDRVSMYCNDVYVYVLTSNRYQVIVLDLNLNFIDDFRMRHDFKGLSPCFTVAKNGDIVLYSPEGKGTFFIYNNKMKLRSKVSIDLKLFEFLFFDPPKCMIENRLNRNRIFLKSDMIRDTKRAVFCLDTANLFIFNGNRLEDQFKLYSRKILDQFKPRLARSLKQVSHSLKIKKGRTGFQCGYLKLFRNFFIDKDTGKSFYLEYIDVNEKTIYLYNFDFEGNLLKIYQFSDKNIYLNKMSFKLKRNKLFYARDGDDKIVTYREK
jgi:hypothetical protein